jgi:hypothetical protein
VLSSFSFDPGEQSHSAGLDCLSYFVMGPLGKIAVAVPEPNQCYGTHIQIRVK